jgi:hypothetical protein
VIIKRAWHKRIRVTVSPHLEANEGVVAAVPATPHGAILWWLIDLLRRRSKVYVIALTNSRLLVLSIGTGLKRQTDIVWAEARAEIYVDRWHEGRMVLRRRTTGEGLDVEVPMTWWREAKTIAAELSPSVS